MKRKLCYNGTWQRDNLITVHHVQGGRYPTATHNGYAIDITKGYAAYVCGAKPPHYPVPVLYSGPSNPLYHDIGRMEWEQAKAYIAAAQKRYGIRQ